MSKLKELYENKGVLFALLWIILYCAVMTPVKGNYGEDSIYMLLALLIVAAAILAFVRSNRMEADFGLAGWPEDTKRYLYFIPMWVLATGNLWGGISLNYRGAGQIIAILSMLTIGFIEEMIFRGFLFTSLLRENRPAVAIIISAVTFGMGHIVNLFAGQASLETFIQIIFAVAWGFMLTMVLYRSGSLLPCIIAHGFIDAFSTMVADNHLADMIYVWATIITAIVYCTYLWRLQETESTHIGKESEGHEKRA